MRITTLRKIGDGPSVTPGAPFESKLLINYYVTDIDLLDKPFPVTKKRQSNYI